MRNKQRYINLLILIGFTTTLISCNGQLATSKKTPVLSELSVASKSVELDQAAKMLFQDSRGNYWFSSKEKGVYKYDGQNLVQFTKADGLPSYFILSIQEDASGNIYLDTTDGVCKYNGEKFSILEVTKGDSQDNWSANPNDLWFSSGFQHSGPFRFNGEELVFCPFPKNELEKEFFENYPNASFNPYGIYQIHKDEENNIWFGTANLGLYQFDGKEIFWQNDPNWTTRPNGMTFGVRALAKDKNSYYWICNTKYKYERVLKDSNSKIKDLKSINLQPSKGFDEDLFFLHIQSDNAGVLWMVTFDNGIWENDGEKLKQHFIKVEGKDISANAICKDNSGTLWFSTNENGVFKYDKGQFVKFEL